MTPEDILRLRRELTAIRTRIEELRDAVHENAKAICATKEAQRQKETKGEPINAIISYDDKAIGDTKKQQDTQKSIKNATWAAVIAAAIYAGISILIWCEMRIQTARNAEQFDEGMRPWVKAELLAGPITFDDMGAKVSVSIKLTNVGHSPALNTYVPRPTILNQQAIANVNLIQRGLCAPYETPDPLNDSLGQIIFAGDATTKEFEDLRIESKDLPSDTVLPWVIGCVVYKIGYSGQHRQTDFFYYFRGVSSSGGDVPIMRGTNYRAGGVRAILGSYPGNGAN